MDGVCIYCGSTDNIYIGRCEDHAVAEYDLENSPRLNGKGDPGDLNDFPGMKYVMDVLRARER